MRVSKQEREESIAKLREWIPEGSTVWTILTHVSKSGMSRTIKPVIIENNEPRFPVWHISRALGMPTDKRGESLKIGGCGMDMGFALVYELAQTLYGNGYKLKQAWM